VHRGEGIEELGVHELQPGPEELGSDEERHHAAHEEHGEREPQVERADVLVVRREKPALEPGRMGVRVVVVVAWSWAWVAALMGAPLSWYPVVCRGPGVSACERLHFRRLDLARLVAPGGARIGDHRGQLAVREAREGGHRRALLAVQDERDLRALGAGGNLQPSSAGNAGGMPLPVAWWQAEQLAA